MHVKLGIFFFLISSPFPLCISPAPPISDSYTIAYANQFRSKLPSECNARGIKTRSIFSMAHFSKNRV